MPRPVSKEFLFKLNHLTVKNCSLWIFLGIHFKFFLDCYLKRHRRGTTLFFGADILIFKSTRLYKS